MRSGFADGSPPCHTPRAPIGGYCDHVLNRGNARSVGFHKEDEHLRVVLRSIERNPLRAGLVGRAEDWPWSSHHAAAAGPAAAIRPDPGPAPRGEGWVE